MNLSSNVERFINLAAVRGSDVVYHREDAGAPCPCITDLGHRDPKWHKAHPPTPIAPTVGAPIVWKWNGVNVVTVTYINQATGRLKQLRAPFVIVNSPTAADAGTFSMLFTPTASPFTVGLYDYNSATLLSQHAFSAGEAFGAGFPVCNEHGEVDPIVTNMPIRGFVQPVQSGATRRLTSDYLVQMFGEIEADDHLGIFPTAWKGIPLEFQRWSQAGEDFLTYNGRRFIVVNANLIPDPANGEPHHWECGLRVVKNARVNG